MPAPFRFGVIALGAILAGGSSLAGPPGQWSAFKNSLGRLGRSPLPGPPQVDVLWIDSDTSVQSGAVIARDGTVFVGSDFGTFVAYDLDGGRRWAYQLDSYITATPALGPGGTVYGIAESGRLFALRPDGELLWAHDLREYAGPSASPAVGRDGTLYVGTSEALRAYSADGRRLWTHRRPVDGPPAIGPDGALYVPSGRDVLCLEPDGSLRWSFDTRESYGPGSAPAVAPDGTIYVNTLGNVLYAIGPDGALRWRRDHGGIVVDVPSSPALTWDDTIVVGHAHGHLDAFAPDGTLLWQRAFAGALSAPTVDGEGTIYVGDNDGVLWALHPDGTEKWRFDTGCLFCYVRTEPVIGAGYRLYVGAYNGFYALGCRHSATCLS